MKLKSIIRKVNARALTTLYNLHIAENWSDEKALKYAYWKNHFCFPNLDTPKTFNEKLLWLKLHDHNPQYTKMVDKVGVKEYVAEKIGFEYVIPTLGVYDSFDDIDFDSLPPRFVMKCNHNSGGVVVCNDKNKLNRNQLRVHFQDLLKKNYYISSREWPYKNVKPQIIIEENIQPDNKEQQINDYKIMCFNGKVRCSFVCSNRTKESLYVNFYDVDWNPMPFERHYPKNPVEIEKPSKYDDMVRLAEILATDIPFVRVDFYQVNDKLYFGELTFYPGGGIEEFDPKSYDLMLGKWLDLSDVQIRI